MKRRKNKILMGITKMSLMGIGASLMAADLNLAVCLIGLFICGGWMTAFYFVNAVWDGPETRERLFVERRDWR